MNVKSYFCCTQPCLNSVRSPFGGPGALTMSPLSMATCPSCTQAGPMNGRPGMRAKADLLLSQSLEDLGGPRRAPCYPTMGMLHLQPDAFHLGLPSAHGSPGQTQPLCWNVDPLPSFCQFPSKRLGPPVCTIYCPTFPQHRASAWRGPWYRNSKTPSVLLTALLLHPAQNTLEHPYLFVLQFSESFDTVTSACSASSH